MLAAERNDMDEPSRKRAGKPFRTIMRISFLLFLILLAAFVCLHLPWFQQQMIGKMVDEVEKSADVRIKFGRYRWSPLSAIRLESLEIESGGKEFLQCKQAELSYRLSMKWPYLVPTVLVLDEPVLHLEKDSHGRWRLPKSDRHGYGQKKPTVESDRWSSFPWPEVRIVSGRIFAMQQGQTVLSLQNVTGTITFNVQPGDDGPTLKIRFGQWQSSTDLSGCPRRAVADKASNYRASLQGLVKSHRGVIIIRAERWESLLVVSRNELI